MTAYCSIMTLLLAFFIILQAFAPTQNPGLFYSGQGSFIRALETFGLGGVLPGGGRSIMGDQSGACYMTEEGQDDPSTERRIDPELENAELALQALEDQFDVRNSDSLTGWRATLPTPFAYDAGAMELNYEEEEFCKELAWRLAPLVFARGFVIRIGAELTCDVKDELEHTQLALAAAAKVRAEIIQNMAPPARPVAARRLYCFCRRATGDEQATGPGGRLRVDILLTKPEAKELPVEGVQESADHAIQE